MTQYSVYNKVIDWSIGGLNLSNPEDGGIECRDHVSSTHRVVETVIGLALGYLSFNFGHASHKRLLAHARTAGDAGSHEASSNSQYKPMRIFLLVALCLVFGIEVGFKFVTRQVIFLLYPCHVISMGWIYVLASPSAGKSSFNLYFLYH